MKSKKMIRIFFTKWVSSLRDFLASFVQKSTLVHLTRFDGHNAVQPNIFFSIGIQDGDGMQRQMKQKKTVFVSAEAKQ